MRGEYHVVSCRKCDMDLAAYSDFPALASSMARHQRDTHGTRVSVRRLVALIRMRFGDERTYEGGRFTGPLKVQRCPGRRLHIIDPQSTGPELGEFSLWQQGMYAGGGGGGSGKRR